MEIFDKYCRGSGAKVNKEKTEYMKMGKVDVPQGNWEYKEQKNYIKILGITLGYDEIKTREIIWDELINKMEKRLCFWKQRVLFLKGKVLVLNSLFLSKMWYVLSVVSLPTWVYKKIKTMILKFLWDDKPSKIAYNTIIGKVDEGGLGLIDPWIRMKSMRIKTLKKFLNEDNIPWKSIMSYFINKCGQIGDDFLWMAFKDRMIENIPEFYKELLRTWKCFYNNIQTEIEGRKLYLQQPLFLNQNNKSKKQMFYENWYAVGFRQVKDILYEIKPGFLPTQAIIDTLEEIEDVDDKEKIEDQYKKLRLALPDHWIKTIEENEKETENRKIKVFLKMDEDKISINDCPIKMFYTCLCNTVFKKPKSREFWEKLFENFDTSNIWKNVRSILKSPALENFDFMLRHNCIMTEIIFKKIGVSQDDLCKVCLEKKEGVLHLFLNCKKLSDFMKMLKTMVCNFLYDENIILEEWDTLFLFGFNGKTKNKFALNYMLTLARFTIWKRRNIMKQKKKEIPLVLLYKQIVTEEIMVIYDYCKMYEKMDIFEKCITKNNPYIVQTWTGFEVFLPGDF